MVFEFKMEWSFYLQQRFFTLIEFGNKLFISNQGPGNWGNDLDDIFASNIVIKNGILGLTSHQSIHGNNNENIFIKDIKIYDFEIAGISLNGFNGLNIANINIGPNHQNIPLMPQYTHGRLMLQRLAMIEDRETKFVYIGNIRFTAQTIYDNLQNEMDAAFIFSMKNINRKPDEIYSEIINNNLFLNNNGLPKSGSLYGIFLNSYGFNRFGIGNSPQYSYNLRLENISIIDLRNSPMEIIRFKEQRGPFNDLFDIKNIIDLTGNYIGTSYSNAQYILSKLIDDKKWNILGHTFIFDETIAWISDKRNEIHLQSSTKR